MRARSKKKRVETRINPAKQRRILIYFFTFLVKFLPVNLFLIKKKNKQTLFCLFDLNT